MDVVSADCIDQLVQRYCDDHRNGISDFEICNYRTRPISDTPLGFLGQHYFLEILIKPKHESKDTILLNFFVKKAPTDIEAFKNYAEDLQIFKKEFRLFEQVLSRMLKIQLKFGKFAPESYYADEKLIIMENLTEQGYRSKLSNDQLLDYSHLLCGVRALAKFHSASIVLELKLNKRLDVQYPGIFTENSFLKRGITNTRTTAIYNGALAVCALIKIIPKYRKHPKLSWITEEYLEKLQNMNDFVRSSKQYRNTFVHGDLWSNNLMFRYDDLDNPIDCKLVDFQFSRYAPPVLDLVTLLSVPTTSAFRKKHMDALMENYYHFLEEFLVEHDVRVDDFIGRIEFKECIEHYREFGLLMSCHVSNETLIPSSMALECYADSEQFTDFIIKDRQKTCVQAFENDSVYRERMTDMITDLVDNFILKNHNGNIY